MVSVISIHTRQHLRTLYQIVMAVVICGNANSWSKFYLNANSLPEPSEIAARSCMTSSGKH